MQKLSKNNKNAFFLALILGLLTHGFRLSNQFFGLDSFNYLHTLSRSWTTAQGRYLVFLAEKLRGNEMNTWIIGLLGLVWIAFAAVLMLRILRLKKPAAVFLCVWIMVANPVVTSTFSYMFVADAFFCGLFFAVLSVYLIERYRNPAGFAVSVAALVVSLALYQSYISVSMLLLATILMRMVCFDKAPWREVGKRAICFLALGVAAVLLYLLGMRIALRVMDVSLADYHGVASQSGYSLTRFFTATKNCYIEFARYFLVRYTLNFYNSANVLYFCLAAVVLIMYVLDKKLYRSGARLAVLVLYILLLPVITHIFNYLTEEVPYVSTPMRYSVCLVYVLPLIFMEERSAKLPAGACRFMLAVICFWSMVIASRAYEKTRHANEQMANFLNRLEIRMEMQDGYSEDMPLAIIGNVFRVPEYVPDAPMMSGVADSLFMESQNDYIQGLNWYQATHYRGASKKRRAQLISMEEFSQMHPWPEQDCVRVIDGTMLVYLSDSDVQELKSIAEEAVK